MGKEHEVCKQLKKWFESYKIKCWLNQEKNKFTVKGLQKKPDLIIYSKKLTQYIAIEVKSGDDKNAVRSGVKIIDYWKYYVDNKTQYYINNKKINISSFCIATLGSMYGKIFLKDGTPKDSHEDSKTQWKLTQLKYKLEPRWEYPKSKEYLRLLWANWKRIRQKNQPGIGTILSNILNEPELTKDNPKITHPILFDMQYRISFKNKQQWKQKNYLL